MDKQKRVLVRFLPTGIVGGMLAVLVPAMAAYTEAQPALKAGVDRSKSIPPLLDQARNALANSEFKAARDLFGDVLSIDPKNAAALQGEGLSYLGLHEYTKAEPILDKSVLVQPSDRESVYNAAAAHVGAKNCMRAAKLIKEYLDAHPQPDEPMANAMVISLNAADDQAKKSSFYATASAFYKTYNAKLEALAPGYKRWGLEWRPAEEVAQNQSEATSRLKDADQIAKEGVTIEKKIEGLQAELPELQRLVDSGFRTIYELDQKKQQIEDLQTKRDAKQKTYDELLASVPKPTYPATLEPLAQGTMPPPDVHLPSVQTASASPSINEPSGEVPKPKPKKNVKPKPKIAVPRGNGENGGTATVPDASTLTVKGSTGGASTPPENASASTPDPTPAIPATPPASAIIVRYAAAFPVAPDMVVTSAASVDGATKFDLTAADGTNLSATLVRADADSGLALLRLTDRKMQFLSLATDFKGGAVKCAAFSSVNIFNPSAEYITGSTLPPGDGWKVRLAKSPRLAGAPLVVDGKVVGVQLGDRDADPLALPAATLAQLKKFLDADAPAEPGKGTAVEAMLQLTATKTGA